MVSYPAKNAPFGKSGWAPEPNDMMRCLTLDFGHTVKVSGALVMGQVNQVVVKVSFDGQQYSTAYVSDLLVLFLINAE